MAEQTRDKAYDLAEYAATLRYEDIPESAIEATKRDIYDSLATGLVGSTALGVEELMEWAGEMEGKEEATVFVFGKKYPAHMAAMINTVMIHGFDYDDTHDTAMMHCGAIMLGTALAVAEAQGGVTGKELLTALTIGLDIHCRLGMAATVGIVESGWVYTPLMGIFGATATAGRLMGLDKDQMINAFGIAYAQASGNYQAIADSAWTKRLQPGFASNSAITACRLAKKGFIGAKNIFEGRFNLYHIYLNDRVEPERITEGLGKVFLHEDLAFKPCPCCGPNQPPISVCLEARELFDLDPDQIKHVEIRMNEHLYLCSCVPEEVRKHPTTIVEAQFSIPYCSAAALIYGKVGLFDFTEEGLQREDVQALAAKIDGVIDPEIEKNYRARVCPVDAIIELYDGTVYTHHLETRLGNPANPMTEKHFYDKMLDCIRFCAKEMPEGTADILQEMVNTMETMENSNEIVAAMQAK